jgi:ribosome-associated toxin RatA of RatAB toxin-antitoxin module/effector-binding domain-containing protein
MKFIKTLLIVIVIALIGGIVYVIAQPDAYKVSRTKMLHVPVDMAFNTVNDLKTYEDWGPWHQEDSTIVVTYTKKTNGEGAMNTWISAEGPGKMWTTDVTPNKEIKQKIQYEDYEPGELIWKFDSMDDSTKVTWIIKSDKTPFVFKMLSVFSGGWENMFGPMQERGLDKLDSLLTRQYYENMSYSISEPKRVNLDGVQFVGYKINSNLDQQAMSDAFSEYMQKASREVMKKGLSYDDFTPGAVFYKWDLENNESEFLIGVKLKRSQDLDSFDIDNYSTDAIQAIMISKYGNYGNGDMEAHIAIDKYLRDNELKPEYPVFELYVNDPAEVKPKDIQTDIYYPLLD